MEPSRGSKETNKKGYSWAEIKQHASRESCWIVLGGEVYDVSQYLKRHPGGAQILLENAGRETLGLFNAVHPWVNYRALLREAFIGRVQK
ncbi:hypothetical protein NEDG_00599 [Nematocida displodere]|uniref:Cytochrome b5 heme-binding domain-containing protein n=1 Tax=Nematocida displodere TaxID=1805483 RepID=A0A177ECK8_9MICR|nr:hypothetical protein NEDG_00599 [Nematocida displodere]